MSNSGTTISKGSMEIPSQPTKPNAQIAATRLVMMGVKMPTVLRMYNASANNNAATVTAKMPNIWRSY